MKIALCLSGHARTYDQTYKFWKKNLLTYHDVDIFMNLWDTIGPRWFGEGRAEGMNPLPRGDFDSGIIESPLLDASAIAAMWKPVSINVDVYSRFHHIFENGSMKTIAERDKRGIPAGYRHHHPLSVRSMLYKRMVCNDMKTEYEYATGQTYELVIQCRPDVALIEPLSEQVLTDHSHMYFHNSKSPAAGSEIVDFGSVGTSSQIDFYCDLYNQLDGEMENVGEDFFEFLNPHKMYVNYFNRNKQSYAEVDLGICIIRDTGKVLGWPEAASIVKNFKE